MKRFIPHLLVSFFALSLQAEHPAPDAEGFVTIFDGSSMEHLETEGNWKVAEDGSLVLEPREGEEGWTRYHHYLWLKETYGDFVFDFEYKLPAGGNSGFYFRAADRSDPVASGYEVQIMDSSGKPDDEMGPHDLGGIIKTKGASKNMSREPGEWSRMTVRLEDGQLIVTLNGEVIQDFDLAEEKPEGKELADEGLLSIQDHGQPFAVRNLRVKRL